MYPRALLCLLVAMLTLNSARATLAEDVAVWDEVLAAVPEGATTVTLGDQIVPLALARAWRDRLDRAARGEHGTNLAAQNNVTLWPNGNVYYSFSGTVSANHKVAFQNAAKDWEMAANVHFIARTTEANYILVNDDSSITGGSSTIGMAGNGPQIFNIGSTAWNRPTLLHELGHTLGLIHEHQRSDRDSYVTISTSGHVASGDLSNFPKMMVSNNLTAYDFLSVMHYARKAFSTNGADTITPLPAYAAFADIMGRQFNPILSRLDRQGIAGLYGPSPFPASLVVNNVNDSGPGSLRAALVTAGDMAADNPALHPAITFQIAAPVPADSNVFSGGTYIIRLSSALLPQANTFIDGDTEGNNNPAGPEIRLTRAAADAIDAFAPGVQLIYPNSELRHLAIDGFNGPGVEITGAGASGDVVAGCFIGTTPNGSAAAPNANEGVLIRGQANHNVIGGTTAAMRNLISGNTGNGIVLSESGTTGNIIEGNWIGLNAAGTAALPNGLAGIYVHALADGTVIGGTAAGAGNVVAGNTNQGIAIVGPTTGNTVLGNFVGTNPEGTVAVPNGFSGVAVFNGAAQNTIGGLVPGARNVISGNKQQGVAILGAATTGTRVVGNYVGLNAKGTAALPNGNATATKYAGLSIYAGAQQSVIGGLTAAERNVISGNGSHGIAISDIGTSANIVLGNFIGLNAAGTAAVPNTAAGVVLFGTATNGYPTANVIGGSTAGARNVISGNGGFGVVVSDLGTTGNAASGNFIGLDAAGAKAFPNTSGGVFIYNGAHGNTIGGFEGGASNAIGGNKGYGVWISGANSNSVLGNFIGLNGAGLVGKPNTLGGVLVDAGATGNAIGDIGGRNYIAGNTGAGINLSADGNMVQGNSIGLNLLGAAIKNSKQGVLIAAKNSLIGGSGIGEANRISGNGGSGVVVENSTSTGNAIMGNSIYKNVARAIDLYGGDGAPYKTGATANDTGDADTGPNNLQNFPTLTSATMSLSTTVTGTLKSTPSSTFRLEFFANPSSSAAGDAHTFIGTANTATDANGDAAFSVSLGTVTKGSYLTATATDSAGNTSELAPRKKVTVTSADVDGLPKAWKTANALHLGTNEAAKDPDGDGLSNLAEFYAGTNPRDSASKLQATMVEKVGDDFRITVSTVAGHVYMLEYSDDLQNTKAWRILVDEFLSPGGDLQVIDPSPLMSSMRFYRLRLAQ